MMTDGRVTPARPEGFRAPRQERSRRTLERIARATEALLSERGPGGVTVEEVVARANTSVGAFYTRFESKDDAVTYVRERSWADARERWRDFLAPDDWSHVPPGALAAEVIRRFCRILLAEDRPSRAFYLDLLTRGDEDGLGRIRGLDREIAALVGRLVEERATGSEAAVRDGSAEDGFLLVISGVRDHLLFAPGGGEPALILRLTRMYAASLGLEPPTGYGHLLAMCATARRLRRRDPPAA